MHYSSRPVLFSFAAALSLAGCVSRGRYEAALAQATDARADLHASRRLEGEQRAEVWRLQQELAELKVALASAQEEIEFAGGIAITCGQALDESTTINQSCGATSCLTRARPSWPPRDAAY